VSRADRGLHRAVRGGLLKDRPEWHGIKADFVGGLVGKSTLPAEPPASGSSALQSLVGKTAPSRYLPQPAHIERKLA